MSRPRTELPFGRTCLEVDAPGALLRPSKITLAADESRAVEEALENPIGTPPLRSIVRAGERVTIVANDITRLTRTDLLLPPIVKSLNESGVLDRDITILFALGIHRAQTDDERRHIVGEEIAARIRMVDHISTDDSSLVEIGVTSAGNKVEINRRVWEADRIILTGEIIYHLIAGYSGGRKSLVPGVAGFRTTTFNHRMIFDARCRPGLLDGNPAHEDLLEACRMVAPDFIVNVVLSPEGGLVRVVAGHYDLAHREGCRTVDQMLRIAVDEPYDLIIASAGGFPLDIDLRQAHKGLENACCALRSGGSILFYAECTNGPGNASFEDYVYRYQNEAEIKQALERNFLVGGHKAYWIFRLGHRYDIHLVSTLSREFVERCHFRHVEPAEHETYAARLIRKAGAKAHVGILPYAGVTLPVLRAQCR